VDRVQADWRDFFGNRSATLGLPVEQPPGGGYQVISRIDKILQMKQLWQPARRIGQEYIQVPPIEM